MSDGPVSNDNVGPPPSKAARPAIKSKPRAPRTAAPPETAATAIVGLFGAALGDLSDNMAAIAADCARFANVDRGELVIDVQAVVSALLAARQQGRLATAAQWLQAWSQEQQLLFVMRAPPLGTGLRPTLSKTMRSVVMPRAIALRDITMGSTPEPVGLRHLLFALAEQSPAKWPPTVQGDFASHTQLADMRMRIVDRTALSPLKGEDMGVWVALLDEAPPLPTPAASPPPTEATPLLSDNPATIDTLGRQPLATALATRLVRLQGEEAQSASPAAVMVHLHGAWGSGKSSMVRILTTALAAQEPEWLVVDFNAWRNSRVKPPWWNMLTELKRAVSRRHLREAARIRWIVADPALLRWAWLQLRWAWLSPSVDNVVLVATALLGLALFGLIGADFQQFGSLLKDIPAVLTLATGTVAAVVAAGRALLLGGKRTAESFDALRTDSFRPFITLFDMLVTASPAPVLIVLDDLDRCDAGTVTDLLEGIQTLFRGKPVVFLAVADRHWITTSFAERFKLFAGGDRARPVGDQFLDKMFQLSIPVPRIGRDVQTR